MKGGAYFIYLALYSARDGYGIAFDLESEDGTVIDLWGVYVYKDNLINVLVDNFRSAIAILKNMSKNGIRKMIIRIKKDVDRVIDVNDIISRFESIIKNLLGDVDWRVKYVDDIVSRRVYSLAMKAYKIRGRYPPKI